MPETPGSEFWKNLRPIENSQKPDALPEVYLPKVATDDDRYYVPFTETVGSRPLWLAFLAPYMDARTTIADVAYRWGFSSQAHFARHFRARFGLTPRRGGPPPADLRLRR